MIHKFDKRGILKQGLKQVLARMVEQFFVGGYGWIFYWGLWLDGFYRGAGRGLWLDGFLNTKLCYIQSCLFKHQQVVPTLCVTRDLKDKMFL